MKITVVIPILYAPGNLLYRDAVKSLVASWQKLPSRARKTLQVVLVFNGFPPGTPLPTARFSGVECLCLTNALNRGFTGAVNDGAWFSVYEQKADWVLVLNDDARVDEDFFGTLLPELKPSRAVVSCGVKNSDGSLQSAGITYARSGLTQSLTRFSPTPFFAGTAFFVSASAIRWSCEQFGWLLAEFFFAYAEDVELSIRLQRTRKRVHIVPESVVTHLGSVTAKRGSAFQLYWGYRNLLFVVLLHWDWQTILKFLPQLLWGQLYAFGMLLYKGYWLVYPKILWSVWKNRKILKLYRKTFYEKLADHYSI